MKVFINDKEYDALPEETIIQLSDRAGIHIPRFCYHKHLSVVASCRMCLVDIEGVKNAQPACSTPVREDMKIYTKSKKTKDAQKSSMEFLLINHPLDCPICDQGGECELQDVSLEHGDDHSTYMQLKRVVIDKDVSPLVSTDMTRCIHCSRCVRFGEEISNVKELGLLNRGEDMRIDVFIENNITSELSGNMIDLCPVGALNNKPYRYKARTWDLRERSGISPHDCLGSNIFYHTYKDKILRAVPKENPDINQTWLSDRDRFGYEGIYSKDRIYKSLIREGNKLIELDKQLVVEKVCELLKNSINKNGSDNVGCLISPRSTNEELYLFQKLFRGLSINNIDHRTNECDFSYQDNYPIMPSLGSDLNNLESYDNILLIGVNIKSEFPVLSIRLNQATKKNTKIHSINFDSSDEDFNLVYKKTTNNNELVSLFLNNTHMLDINKTQKTLVINGPSISRLHNQSDILAVIHKYCESLKADMGFLTDHCNTTGAWVTGNIPHRDVGGKQLNKIGLNSYDMLKKKLSSYVLYNLEPELDFHDIKLLEDSLKESKCNIIFTNYLTPMIEKYADIIIPISTYAETKGSFINIEGKDQYFENIVKSNNNIFEGWDVLSKIYAGFNLDSYKQHDKVREELIESINGIDHTSASLSAVKLTNNYNNDSEIFFFSRRHLYRSDSIVKRSKSLQLTLQSKEQNIFISENLKNKFDKINSEYLDEFNIRDIDKRIVVNKNLSNNTIIFPSSTLDDQCVIPKSSNIELKL